MESVTFIKFNEFSFIEICWRPDECQAGFWGWGGRDRKGKGTAGLGGGEERVGVVGGEL